MCSLYVLRVIFCEPLFVISDIRVRFLKAAANVNVIAPHVSALGNNIRAICVIRVRKK